MNPRFSLISRFSLLASFFAGCTAGTVDLGIVDDPAAGGAGGSVIAAGGAGGMGDGGAGGSGECTRGEVSECYSGPDGTLGKGLCQPGTQTCSDSGIWDECLGEVLPTTETCDTEGDDDCDGLVNEDGAGCNCTPGDTQDCYSAAANTKDVGPCIGGTQTCKESGDGWGECVGEVAPVTETCADSIDNDCDGETNESGVGCVCTPNASEDCYTGPAQNAGVGICAEGTRTCNGQGTAWGGCSGDIQADANETCGNGTDDDCDGQTDDGCGANVLQLALGGNHTCALLSGGVVKCWGANNHSQLGTPESITGYNSKEPLDVSGLSGVTAIAAGDEFTCALTSAGAVKCWGSNIWGQVGVGSIVDDYSSPQDVSGLSGVVAIEIDSEGNHACALLSSGVVKCWGKNAFGQLGIGSVDSWVDTPQDVPELFEVTEIEASAEGTCAVLSDTTVKCWGILPTELSSTSTTPLDVAGLSGVAALSTGGAYTHACVLLSAGGVKCWGNNLSGKLGIGSTVHQDTPQDVFGLSAGVTAITAGYHHTCALLSGGAVKCWGENSDGQLGIGSSTGDYSVPQDVLGLSSGVDALEAGGSHNCVVVGSTVKCWGYGHNGALGNGSTTDSSVPVDVVGL